MGAPERPRPAGTHPASYLDTPARPRASEECSAALQLLSRPLARRRRQPSVSGGRVV